MMNRLLRGNEEHVAQESEGVDNQLWQRAPRRVGSSRRLGLPSTEKLFVVMVREEVEEVQRRLLCSRPSGMLSSVTQMDGAVMGQLQLQFMSNLPRTLYTGNRIESEQNTPVKIAITDADEIVTSGPLASLKVDLVPVDGDFCHGVQRDQIEQEFTHLQQREGKPPLLTGDLVVTLQNGIGYLGNVRFTDNSRWRRSRKFRLGLRVRKCNSLGYRIREGISESFIVKDHRGESSSKNHPPALDDEVWRLENIGKNGPLHQRLLSKKICTIQDFLRLLVVDEDKLHRILGMGRTSRTWKAIVQHARECQIRKDSCFSHHVAEKQVTLFFDSIFQIVEVTEEGCRYPYTELPTHLKTLVDNEKGLLYQELAGIVERGEPMPSCPMTLQDEICFMPRDTNFIAPITHEDEGNTQIGIEYLPVCDMEVLHDDSHPQKLNADLQQLCQVQHELASTSNLSSAGLLHHSRTADGMQATSTRKWFKLLTTVKCGMSIRKRVVAKRKTTIQDWDNTITWDLDVCDYLIQSPSLYGSF